MSIRIDFTKNLGKIKPMHGVGQPPFSGARSFPMFHYLTEAGIQKFLHSTSRTLSILNFVRLVKNIQNSPLQL